MLRRDLVDALRLGVLTALEASRIAAVTRQRVMQWCKAEGFNPRKTRLVYLKMLWASELKRQRMLARGRKPRRRSKADLRKIADRAKLAWDKKKR